MKIGIVTTWQERGAAYVSKQYRDILKKDNEVFVYARGGEKYAIGDLIWDKNYVTWGKKIPIHMPQAIDLNDFKKWLIKNKIDLVFFNEQQWWDPILLCQDLNIKTGAYIDYYTKETVSFFEVYDFLICNTRRHLEAFKWHPQAYYIPWGTDIQLFKAKNLSAVENSRITFFHSSGMSPERKGTDILIKAFSNLSGSKKLIIHTQTDLEESLPNLKDSIKKMRKGGLLEIINKEISAPGLYHLGDVYVYPSRLDGIGLTICEALACGLPVITSDNAPMNEFVDNSNGRLVKIEKYGERSDGYFWPLCEVNQDLLTSAMQYYIDNFKVISGFKNNARKSAEARFDWSKNSLNLSHLFRDSKVIEKSEELINKVRFFEKKRSNIATKIYRRYPWLFKPFSWFWPIIKNFYISKK